MGGITGAKMFAVHLYILNLTTYEEDKNMRLLTPYEVAEITGLTYARALIVVKSANHLQINNRYYISESTLRAFLNPDTPILIESEEEEEK